MKLKPNALPLADPAETEAIFDWLVRFAACVRAVDYAAARPFWHPDIIVFGTYQELIRGRERWVASQWDNVWPRTEDFAFDLDNTAILLSDDGSMATVIAPWTSTGFYPDGARFDRPGRATIVLARQPTGAGSASIPICRCSGACRRTAMAIARSRLDDLVSASAAMTAQRSAAVLRSA